MISSGNGLPSVRCGIIVNWTYVNSMKFEQKCIDILSKNEFEYVICKMSAILFRPQYVKIIGYTILIRRVKHI